MLNGRLGQVVGPFNANVDLLDDGEAIGVFTPETTRPALYKLGIQADVGTIININYKPIKIGYTGIYELDNVVTVNSLIFPNGTNSNTIIDFVY